MVSLVAFQERLVYVPVLPGLTKSYAITVTPPPHLRGRLVQIHQRRPTTRLVHQVLSRLPRQFSCFIFPLSRPFASDLASSSNWRITDLLLLLEGSNAYEMLFCQFHCKSFVLLTIDLHFVLVTQLTVIGIAHRLEVVRVMLQKLHCNVFMLSQFIQRVPLCSDIFLIFYHQ